MTVFRFSKWFSLRGVYMLAASFIFLASCNTGGQKGTISGELKGAEGKTLYLQRVVNDRMVSTDSTVIGSDGSFLLAPRQSLSLDLYRLGFASKEGLYIVTDSTENLVLKGDMSDLVGTTKASGSAATENYRELELELAALIKKDQAVVAKLSNPAISPEEKSQNRDLLNASRKQQSDLIKKWLEENSTSLGSLMAVTRLDPRADGEYYNKVVASLDPIYGKLPILKTFKKEIGNIINSGGGAGANSPVAIGKVAPEIALPDPKGVTRKLSDLKGKTVLIDFWASWCGPCRKENPVVVAAYNKYNKDGFEVFSVSLDRAKDLWVEAIAKDGLKWPNHVSDLKWWESEAARTYGVSSIPKAFLIDKDGKIIASDLRGPALEAKLQSIYGH